MEDTERRETSQTAAAVAQAAQLQTLDHRAFGKIRRMPYDITYMRDLKYDTSELISETETKTHRHTE